MPQIPWRSDSGLLPSMLILRYLATVDEDEARYLLDGMPSGNGSLPDLLHLAGIERVDLADHIDFPCPIRWQGHGGNQIELHSYHDQKQLRAHHGPLPQLGNGWIESDNEALFLINIARLEDAQSVMDGGEGADWQHILQALGVTDQTALSPIIRDSSGFHESGHLQVWNPLPIQRHCAVRIPKPAGTPPWGLCDSHGKHYPIQITEGAYGPEMLSIIPLGPLECVSLETYDSPVSKAYWEISDSVIDNGLLRAELNDRGNIMRLQINGRFVDLGGVLCQALIDNVPLQGPCSIQVLESGPVRAQIAVSIDAPQGVFRLSYELYAYEDILRVNAHWSNPEIPIVIDHATSYRRAPLTCAAELAPWHVDQVPNAFKAQMPIQGACNWARLTEYNSTRGLAIASEQGCAMSAHAGHLRVHPKGDVRYALMNGVSAKLGNPGRVVQHLSMPGRAAADVPLSDPAFLLSDADDLVPLWIRHVGEQNVVMLLSEQAGQRGKALLLPVAKGIANADRINVHGHSIRPLKLTKEEDGFEIDYAPFEVFLVRWKLC